MTEQPATAGTSTPADVNDDAGRLAGIETRERAATVGPWSTEGPDQPGMLKADDGRRILGVFGGHPQDEADAQFTAHARQDVPFLLARGAAHTWRTGHLEQALAAVTDFAEADGDTEPNNPWRHGYCAARQDLLDILRITQPGVTAVPDSEPLQHDLPHPHVNALRTDVLGRPLCEGTRYRETRNCEEAAAFQLLRAGTRTVDAYACSGHLGQVVDTVNGGERGSVLVHQIAIKE
ncbi:hypothetical protein ACIP6P_26470 [Streptomyces sp. NPDC088729]|uniref:hypothetical protein n=1 Tax=Streptomyces sp. NPDC088729 TaxID=3365876 RepID=UPI00381F9175